MASLAAGAANDATLYDQHFDGTELNGLGLSKVALMLQAAPKNEPLTIYIPPSMSPERVQQRLAAVNRFWRDSQWAAQRLQMKQGSNPDINTSAAAGLAGLRRMEKEQMQQAGVTGGPGQSVDTTGMSGGGSGGGGGGSGSP